MIKKFHANQARLRRHRRMRRHLAGSQERPRLNIFRSGHHIYAQIIDDTTGRTLAAASSLDAGLRDFKPAPAPKQSKKAEVEQEAPVEVAAEAAPRSRKAEKAPAKGGKQQSAAPTKTLLPAAQKGERKTPVEALVAIAHNRRVALAREVGKLVAQRAKENGVS
ncbi:MAG: hypothetical protein J2P37_03010, partial [Ktedonobacteraceae bacterium]|nr:hypothetical protein [Ktedonobacteraceae bacterium]